MHGSILLIRFTGYVFVLFRCSGDGWARRAEDLHDRIHVTHHDKVEDFCFHCCYKHQCGFSGDGWARRAEDAVLHGCIPVIIMDGVEEKFSGVVDYGAFSLRVPESDIEQVRSCCLYHYDSISQC